MELLKVGVQQHSDDAMLATPTMQTYSGERPTEFSGVTCVYRQFPSTKVAVSGEVGSAKVSTVLCLPLFCLWVDPVVG